MAKDKDAVVELEEEGVVTIDVSDNPDLVEEPEKEEEEVEVEAKPEPKKPLPRVRLNEQKAVPAVDEAAAALKEAADRRVAAAEATASAERVRREAAERNAAQHAQDADDARAVAEKSQLTIIDNGIEAATREVEAHEAQYAAALEQGDFKGAASIQTKLSKATATLDRLEAAKADVASGVRKVTTEGRVEAVPQNQSVFEQYLAQFTPEAQNWLRLHPECAPANVGGNAAANNKMMAGHYAASAQNIAPNTPEYFRVIEEHTGYRQPTSGAAAVTKAGEEQEEAPAPKAKPRLQASAPPSREPPTARGLPPAQRTVTLTKDQQEMAKMSFPNMTPQQAFATYARNMIELEAEGKLGRTTH